jgi:hypothetical protein
LRRRDLPLVRFGWLRAFGFVRALGVLCFVRLHSEANDNDRSWGEGKR